MNDKIIKRIFAQIRIIYYFCSTIPVVFRDMKVLYFILYGAWYVLSLLPLWVHYLFSDVLYFLIYYLLRYRRRVVRSNLATSFPEKSADELKQIERTIIVSPICFSSSQICFQNTKERLMPQKCKPVCLQQLSFYSSCIIKKRFFEFIVFPLR